jgi:hypothetical protein
MDDGDQPVLVSANVEHDEVSNSVRRRERGPQTLKIIEVTPLYDLEPTSESSLAIGVPLPELA